MYIAGLCRADLVIDDDIEVILVNAPFVYGYYDLNSPVGVCVIETGLFLCDL